MSRLLPTRRSRHATTVVAVTLIALLAPTSTPGHASGGSVAVTGNPRVDALIAQMTLDEKVAMIHGDAEDPSTYQFQAGYLPGVPRLGIPGLRFADGPPGVATMQWSTGMTSTMGLAATFSRLDARLNGAVIGHDARALGQDVMLQPFINIDRDIVFYRGYNTFGEDPLLTGQLGAETIRGIQSAGVLAQAKHFVAYEGGTNIVVDEQTLHEVYLKPFQDAVNARVASVMCAYNKINSVSACGNAYTQNDVLRGRWGFEGFVTADWGANHATTDLVNGLDLSMPGLGFNDYFQPQMIRDAIRDGIITEAHVNRAVGRILLQYLRFGLLDGASKHEVTPQPVELNAVVVRKTAADSATLLKNSGGILPLKAADLASLAMIGPGAGQTIAIGRSGEKSTGRAERWVGAATAIRRTVPGAHVTYAPAMDFSGVAVPASALSHDGQPGLVRTNTATGRSVVDPQVNSTVSNGNPLGTGSAHTWTGTLTAPETGTYWVSLALLGADGALYVDGQEIIPPASNYVGPGLRYGTIKGGDDGVLPSFDALDLRRTQLHLAAGAHTVEVRQTPDLSGKPVQIRLSWVPPSKQAADRAAAVEAARHARTAVVFAWNGVDSFGPLPEGQDQLIADVAAANPNTIVVLNTSQPIAMPWLPSVKGLLQMWYPGDEGGWATADVLLGRVNPAGRLPFTWPVRLADNVANDPAHPERSTKGLDAGGVPCPAYNGGPFDDGCTTIYTEGIHVGYRWYDKQGITPLYPFGHGLSYSRFQYSGLRLSRDGEGGLAVTFTLTNTGAAAGDEVPQVYLGAPAVQPAGVQFAAKALAAFDRVRLGVGESRALTLRVAKRELSCWSAVDDRWRLATGPRTVHVGASSTDLQLQAAIDIIN
ncbi:MAG TPA: glycoside hydrolase family 3 C-terminal domain-containing protein [Micromonosporaceae bacterium]|nr:glycoside hydrolase family 3 C-terminal domain-containing protein [Micromonosporaceae bacterium]